VLYLGSSRLAFVAAISTFYFGMLSSKVRHLQHSILMANGSKPVFLRGFIKPMFF